MSLEVQGFFVFHDVLQDHSQKKIKGMQDLKINYLQKSVKDVIAF